MCERASALCLGGVLAALNTLRLCKRASTRCVGGVIAALNNLLSN